ncbi:MAG TPA: ABC transporter permease [Gemmatimonadaceae bacterium]|nr:ABC transporter permease [Gemmatimonadaceae bacterium]
MSVPGHDAPAPDWRRLVRETLGGATGNGAHDEEIVEELTQHLAQRYDEALARGYDPRTAVHQATQELASDPRLAHAIRQAAGAPSRPPHPPPVSGRPNVWNDFWQDLRYGARVLARARGFTTAAVLTLALGVGATTAIFSVVDTVLLRPAPFADHDRLTMVWETDRNTGTVREPASWPDFLDMQRESRQFAALGAFVATEVNHTPLEGEPARLATLAVTHEFLPMLGLRPLTGRTFTPEEDRPGGPSVLLISERLWERQYGRRTDVVGQTIRLNDREFIITGVMPDEADFGTMQILRHAAYSRGFADRDARSRVDLWTPLQADERQYVRSTHPILVVGRLAPGATVEGAHQEMERVMADLEQAYPQANTARGAFVEPMSVVIFGRVRTPLLVLMSAVGVVLLIACVNVGNLLLVRGASRVREVAVRSAMGAVTPRLVRQFVAENLLLSLVASVLGVALAYAGLRALVVLAPPDIPRLADVGIDGRVLLSALGLALATGLSFGLVPIVQARRLDLQSALKSEESRGATAGRARGAMRSALVVSEVALAVMLVIGAGLLIKSFWRLTRVETGFDVAGVLKAEFQLPPSRYRTPADTWPDFAAIHRFNDELLRRASGLPGVDAAAIVTSHPLAPGFTNSFRVVGREDEGRNWPEISVRVVSPGYFDVVKLRGASGRLLGATDGTRSPPVGLINETAARRFFEGRDPLGQQIAFWGVARTIVGVVADEKIHGVTKETPPAVYVAVAQAPPFGGGEALLVRTRGESPTLPSTLRATIREVDPQLAVFGVEPMARTLAESVGQQRFVMLLLVLFAGLALTLAAIGIHGILSYTVAQRRHEIGIRIALGAPPRRVTRLVMTQGVRLTGLGLLVGVVAAFALTRVLANLLFGVSATDAATFVAVLPVLVVVALLATWLPVRRATRIDPLQALREE